MECKNCNKQLLASDNFCGNCGGRVIDQEFTLKYLANDVSERFFNIENNLIWRTIKNLTARPEYVINGYIQGIRKRHLHMANYLALAITISGLQIFLMQKFFQANMDLSWMPFQENNPAGIDNSFLDNIWEYQSVFYIILIPIYALIARMVFFNHSKYTYLHHVVIATYSQAHLSILFFIPTVLALMLGINFFKFIYFFSFPVMIFYSAFVYKRMYSLRLGGIIGKTLLFLGIGAIFYIAFGVLLFIYWVLTGTIDVQEMLEAEKAKQGVSYIASSLKNWTS